MEFKNKQKKGWILEEIEKKTECLESKDFGGEEPEDVEKHQEEVNKEINKRFDGVRKVAQKVVGQDFEEHAKPHKVEVYYVGRKDLGEAIGKLKEQNINYTIKRSPKEGFRYVVEYFSYEHKKDEPLLEKIDLEEEDTNEGMISGAEELSRDELANLEKSLWDKLEKNEIHPEDGTFSNSSNRLADLDLYMVIDGDWKHDHLLAEDIVEEWCKENGYVIIKHTSEEIGDSDQDSYKAEHKWFLVKDTDGKMTDTVNALHHIFTPARDESLKEESKENNWKVHKVTKFKIQDKDLNIDEINGETFDEVVADNLSDKEAHDLVLKLRDEESDDRFTYIQSTKESLKEELPDAIPEEPIVISTEPGDDVATVIEEPSEEVKKAGLYNALSSELRDTLQDIENLKSLTVTFIEEGREDLIDDLNAIIDERTIHSGMLQQLMTRVEGKVEAEETNTEPVKEESLNEGRRENKSFNIKVKNGLYIGDLCYALDDKVYYGVWKDANYEDGAYTDPKTGLEFAMVGTAWGDGNYEGSDGRDYPVDAGIIGICDKDLVAKDINDGGRIVDDVTGDVQISYEDGTIHVMWADGNIDIETDPEDDHDDEEDGESEEESLKENLGDDIEKELKKYADDFEYVADAYDDDNKDIVVFATRNEEAKDKVLKELGDKLGLKDAGYDDREKAWCISKRANRDAKESLEEAKEETIHLDKYEIDDKDSEEQKEDAKIMPYGEVTKKQWEDFLSKAKWPYWLAWENLKNEVEHKD